MRTANGASKAPNLPALSHAIRALPMDRRPLYERALEARAREVDGDVAGVRASPCNWIEMEGAKAR